MITTARPNHVHTLSATEARSVCCLASQGQGLRLSTQRLLEASPTESKNQVSVDNL